MHFPIVSPDKTTRFPFFIKNRWETRNGNISRNLPDAALSYFSHCKVSVEILPPCFFPCYFQSGFYTFLCGVVLQFTFPTVLFFVFCFKSKKDIRLLRFQDWLHQQRNKRWLYISTYRLYHIGSYYSLFYYLSFFIHTHTHTHTPLNICVSYTSFLYLTYKLILK